jgi:hypothetical protein
VGVAVSAAAPPTDAVSRLPLLAPPTLLLPPSPRPGGERGVAAEEEVEAVAPAGDGSAAGVRVRMGRCDRPPTTPTPPAPSPPDPPPNTAGDAGCAAEADGSDDDSLRGSGSDAAADAAAEYDGSEGAWVGRGSGGVMDRGADPACGCAPADGVPNGAAARAAGE